MRLLAGVAFALWLAAPAGAQTWRNVDVSRQLRDTTAHRIRVTYAAGRFSLRATTDPVLFAMQLRYDEERVRPVHEYDALARRATLGIDAEQVRWARHPGDQRLGEMRLALTPAVPLDLELELGATHARVDAGGLALTSLRIETGAADAVLDFSAPNLARMRHLDVELGAAAFVLTNLGNANAASIRVNGGVGSADLDFGGTLSGDVEVDVNMALGKLTVRVPRDVGIRVHVNRVIASFSHPGLDKRDGAFYSDNWASAKARVRLHAQTVFGAIEIVRTN